MRTPTAVALIGAGLATALGLAFWSASSAPPDATLVQCTSKSRRAATVEAAVSLRLVDRGSTPDRVSTGGRALSFDEWRDAERDLFERACEVSVRAAQPQTSPDPLVTALIGLVPIAGGAAIAWFTAGWRDALNRGKAQAAALSKASRAFVTAVRDYCDAQVNGAADTVATLTSEVRHKRDDLVSQLNRTAALRRGWTAPGALEGQVTSGVLGDAISTGWAYRDDRGERRGRAGDVTRAVEEVDRRVDVVVRALETPGRRHAELWAEFPKEKRR
ncbi:hypothetical protein [Saccharothrix xinjiangensis]|uniref:Uncharacterized protein n=1 Tax=Saccharothrix xinjiangensis TaxID=204798 RepID=A0ABV9YGA2_9PSEU